MAFDQRNLTQSFHIVCGLVLGLVMAIFVTTNPAGGLAALIPLISLCLAMVAVIKPKSGLYALAALVIWVDEFKRLAVYFGGAFSTTVVQALAMPFIVLAALNFGYILAVAFGRAKLGRVGIFIYLLAFVIGGAVFVLTDGGLSTRGQRAANMAGYITLIPIACAYLKNLSEWQHFFSFQVVLALPAAAWAIKQYYFGFDNIEWEYARSGLSQVHYSQMFLFKDPRVFGFFGSASAIGCVAIYCSYAWWHGFRFRSFRYGWFLIALLLTWVLFASTQRSALVFPLIVMVCAYCFRTRLRFATLALVGLSVFVLGVAKSDYLLEQGLEDINNALASDSAWGNQVLKVNTFSDRLRGWQRLKIAENWTLFGQPEGRNAREQDKYDVNGKYYNHDVINKILINTGIVGLLIVTIPTGWLIFSVMGAISRAPTKEERNDAALALALALPIVAMSMIGGDNFNTNPINLQIWSAFAGVMIFRNQFAKNQYSVAAAAKTQPNSDRNLGQLKNRPA
jgi:hypothetical protein